MRSSLTSSISNTFACMNEEFSTERHTQKLVEKEERNQLLYKLECYSLSNRDGAIMQPQYNAKVKYHDINSEETLHAQNNSYCVG